MMTLEVMSGQIWFEWDFSALMKFLISIVTNAILYTLNLNTLSFSDVDMVISVEAMEVAMVTKDSLVTFN